jgi:hypothetical protein
MVATTEQKDYKVWFDAGGEYHPRKVSRVHHNYSDHPLLALSALEQLAERLYQKKSGQLRFLSEGIKADSKFDTLSEHRENKSIAEIFKNISNPGSWIAMYAVQSEPEYKKLAWDVINSVTGELKELDPGIFFADAYFFISSPPSVTPYHVDRENVFILQIAGKKGFASWNPSQREVISEEAIEEWIVSRSLDKLKYQPEFLKTAVVNDVVEAGEGLYNPVGAPHMTHAETDLATPESPYSITFSIVFYTKNTRRLAYIYVANKMLRKLGFTPKPAEKNKVLDQFKFMLGRIMVFSLHAMRMYSPPSGF